MSAPAATLSVQNTDTTANTTNSPSLLQLPNVLLEQVWASIDHPGDQVSLLLAGSRQLQQLWDERWPHIIRFHQSDGILLRLFRTGNDRRALRALQAGAHCDDELIQAAQHGLLRTAEYVLQHAEPKCGLDPKYIDTALMRACQQGHVEIARMLLKHGADAQRYSARFYYSPLLEAARWGHTGICQLLLQQEGADVHASNDEALYNAAGHGHLATVLLLLQHGADADAVDGQLRHSPLAAAARNGHPDVVKALVQHGADPHLDCVVATSLAVHYGTASIVERLMPQLDMRNARGSALVQLAASGRGDFLESAILAGADVHFADDMALRVAMIEGKYDAAVALIKHGARTSVLGEGGMLLQCARKGRKELVSLVLSLPDAYALISLTELKQARREFGRGALGWCPVPTLSINLKLRFAQREVAAAVRERNMWGML